MINLSHAFSQARSALFRISIERKNGLDWWGTGFFISTAGHALTAFHNLPTQVREDGEGLVTASDRDGKKEYSFKYVPLDGDQARDIALLRATDSQLPPLLTHLKIAALDDGVTEHARISFWAGRAVLVCGFPFNEQGQEEEPIAGHLRGDSPLGMDDEKDGAGIEKQNEWMRIVPDRSHDLPGISGGLVMDLETGLVVGVEWGCRRNTIFASELHRDRPAWPEEIRSLFVRLENTPTALCDRANSLLEIPSRPWDRAKLPTGALLRAECEAAVPFHGRGYEQGDLEEWCTDEARLGIRLYTAAGGMGKTRLFLEICQLMKGRGWRAGFLIGSQAAHATRDLWGALVDQGQPLLLVVDYAESRRAELASLFAAADRSSRGRVRVVLLARAAGDWWELLKREGNGVGDLLQGPTTRWHELRPLALTDADRLASYWIAVKTYAKALGRPAPAKAPDDLGALHYDRVLLVHMSALAAIDGVRVEGEQGLLDYVLTRERRFWAKQVEAAHLGPALEDGIAQAMTVVTAGGGAKDQRHARAILRQIPLLRDQEEIVRRRISMLLHEAYPGSQWIEPMMPDLLGEHLLQVELGRDDDQRLFDLIFGPRLGGHASPGAMDSDV